jgi:hypothetical protein
MPDQPTGQDSMESAQAQDPLRSPLDAAREAKATAKLAGIGAAAFAVAALLGGIAQQGGVVFLCLPLFLLLALVANTANQNAGRLATGPIAKVDAGKQVGKGILLTVLALFLVFLLVVGWYIHLIIGFHA